MRSKSIINIKKSYAEEIAADRFKYGAILAESYWKEDKNGAMVESQPVTAEILDGFFYPFTHHIDNGSRVYIGRWFTGLRVDCINGPGGVHIERIVLKPDLDVDAAPVEFIESELWKNFREHWSAND